MQVRLYRFLMADNKNSNEIVYFLYSNYHVKIGKCAPKNQDINSEANQDAVIGRLKGCQTGNPHKIYLLGYMFGSESQWHKHFKEYRGNGEWFKFGEVVRDTIKELPLCVSQSYNIDTLVETGNLPERVLEYESNKEEFQDYMWEKENVRDNYEKKEEDLQFAGKNRLEISQFLSRMFSAGYMHLATKRKNRIKDWFGDIIEVDDEYFSSNNFSGANGISVRNAVMLFKNTKTHLELMAVLNGR